MMQQYLRTLFLAFVCLSFSNAYGQTNALALKNGCKAVQKPSTFFTPTAYTAKVNAWSVLALQDESGTSGWCSGAASKAPYVFVFELSEDYSIQKLVFNTFCQKEYTLISAKDIKVEFSITSSKTGFASATALVLEENKINTFDIAPTKARWIKLTILSNYGNPQWTQLMEFEAWGNYVSPTLNQPSLIGVWSSNFDWVSFNKTNDKNLYGCYKWANGEMYLKNINRNVYTFNWKQKDDGQQGWCVLVLNKEGTQMNGIWGLNTDTTTFGNWELIKTQTTPYVCNNDVVANTVSVTKVVTKPVPPINVMIEVLDNSSSKPLVGVIDVYTNTNYYKVPGDGAYTADINPSTFMVVKTALPNYYPTIDTFKLTDNEQKSLYATRTIKLYKLAAGNNILLHNLLFARTSYELLPASLPTLDQLVTVLIQYPDMYIELSGHTDNVGDTKQNVLLSQQRVNAVKQYLVDKGIESYRIKTVGYGEKYPVASNDGEQTRKLNRRVELRIITM
jgi:outer membrane protein OmpA-like peptidoglycan-associated protein